MPYQKQISSTLRQFHIIKQLYTLDTLHGMALAKEYGVSTRTILRDMKKINAVIPLVRHHGKWSLKMDAFAKHSSLEHSLLRSFADNIHIELSYLEKSNLSDSQIAFAMDYNKLPKALGNKIIEALENESRCLFSYVKTEGKSTREIDPIKLYTQDERWYLIARDYKDDRVKTFLLSKMENFRVLTSATTLNKEMLLEADKMISNIWHNSSNSSYKIKLYIKPNIAHYIEEMQLHKTQVIVDRHYDGGLEIDVQITNTLEILPAIKSWLPHIYIIEPKWLGDELMRDLEYYKDEDLKMDI